MRDWLAKPANDANWLRYTCSREFDTAMYESDAPAIDLAIFDHFELPTLKQQAERWIRACKVSSTALADVDQEDLIRGITYWFGECGGYGLIGELVTAHPLDDQTRHLCVEALLPLAGTLDSIAAPIEATTLHLHAPVSEAEMWAGVWPEQPLLHALHRAGNQGFVSSPVSCDTVCKLLWQSQSRSLRMMALFWLNFMASTKRAEPSRIHKEIDLWLNRTSPEPWLVHAAGYAKRGFLSI